MDLFVIPRVTVEDAFEEFEYKPATSTPLVKSTTTLDQENQTPGTWVKTRYCCCPDNAKTDCRFHSPKEKGWETCPHVVYGTEKGGRWLYKQAGSPQLDPPVEP